MRFFLEVSDVIRNDLGEYCALQSNAPGNLTSVDVFAPSGLPSFPETSQLDWLGEVNSALEVAALTSLIGYNRDRRPHRR
jgi:hypothetical protein